MDYVIGFVGQKGGVGKSTLARAIARECHVSGFKVKLADMDMQQATTVKWHLRRLAAGMEPVGSVEGFRALAEAVEAAEHADVLIFDGPGRASNGTKIMATMCDMIIQPSSPSLDDLEPGVSLFHELVQAGIPRSKLYFALTAVGTPNEEELAREYIQLATYRTFNGSLEFKPSYRAALNAGRTVTETNHNSLNRRADVLLQSILDSLQDPESGVKPKDKMDNSYLKTNSKLVDNSYLETEETDNKSQHQLEL